VAKRAGLKCVCTEYAQGCIHYIVLRGSQTLSEGRLGAAGAVYSARHTALSLPPPLRLVHLIKLNVSMSTLSLKIEFGGGLELLFDNKRSHRLAVPARIPASWSLATRTAASTAPNPEAEDTETRPADVRYLIYWLNDHLLRERSELFVEDGTVYVLRQGSCCDDLMGFSSDARVSSFSSMTRIGS
jgi:hypothetical protein